MNYAYILRRMDGSLYRGWINHLDKRIEAYNLGKGTKYTEGRRPITLTYYEEFTTREEAMKWEAAIKRLSRQEKLKLIDQYPKMDYNRDRAIC